MQYAVRRVFFWFYSDRLRHSRARRADRPRRSLQAQEKSVQEIPERLRTHAEPFQKPRLPVWVGGEGSRAQRRAASYGDAWFPYFVRITPQELATRFDNVRRLAAVAGRDSGEIHLNCCRPIELTDHPVPQEEKKLKGTPEQLVEALRAYEDIGVEHLALQFMVARWPNRLQQIERFGREVIPKLQPAAQ